MARLAAGKVELIRQASATGELLSSRLKVRQPETVGPTFLFEFLWPCCLDQTQGGEKKPNWIDRTRSRSIDSFEKRT
jgi:hypothetical protein